MLKLCFNILIVFFTIAIMIFSSAALITYLKEEGFIKERDKK